VAIVFFVKAFQF